MKNKYCNKPPATDGIAAGSRTAPPVGRLPARGTIYPARDVTGQFPRIVAGSRRLLGGEDCGPACRTGQRSSAHNSARLRLGLPWWDLFFVGDPRASVESSSAEKVSCPLSVCIYREVFLPTALASCRLQAEQLPGASSDRRGRPPRTFDGS